MTQNPAVRQRNHADPVLPHSGEAFDLAQKITRAEILE